jgi:hypothetical protein
VKVVSQRKTRAVDHHHPLRSLAPLGLADPGAPFFAGAKLPSRKASLQMICCRLLSSPRKVRQIFSQTSCSSQSRNLRQQVEGEGDSSGKSRQRAPLPKTHKMPSSALRSGAGGRPPRGRDGRLGSNGRSFSHWASVNNPALGMPAWCPKSSDSGQRNRLIPALENQSLAVSRMVGFLGKETAFEAGYDFTSCNLYG